MFKKFLTVTLTFFSFLLMTPVVMAFEYKDVPQDSSYYYPVDYLRRNDVFKDTPYFNPDVIISKAEFVKYLVTLNSPSFRPTSYAELPFEDTRNNAWYASYFKEAIKLGILDERQPKAEPDKKLTVIDALKLLFHSQSIPIPNVYKGGIPYTDVERNTQAQALIMRALQLNLIVPQRADYVGIYQRVTRAQAARMIYQMDLVTLGSATSNSLPQVSNYSNELEKIISVWQLIEGSYLRRGNLDKAQIADNVLKDLVSQLDDPYSTYMDEEENTNFIDGLDGEIEGIGAVIGYNDAKEITIVSPIKGSPADKVGLMPGDIIVEVDDTDTTGMTLEDAVFLIKGPKGTTVKLKIRRSSGTKIFTIERDLIEIPTVEYEQLDGGKIAHVSLSQFNFNAAEEFQQAVDKIKSNPSVKGLIFDLRGNPGGLLDAAVNILGHFVKAQDEVVSIHYADYTQVLLSRGDAELAGFPVVVLIDGGSASASEIVAGALQDYGLATIVGQKSFGKGTVQEVNYFIDNSSLKLTVAKWLTPDLQDIQDGGIYPDVMATDNASTEADEQLNAAIDQIHKLIR